MRVIFEIRIEAASIVELYRVSETSQRRAEIEALCRFNGEVSQERAAIAEITGVWETCRSSAERIRKTIINIPLRE